MKRFIALGERALLAVSGPDARSFLQGLVTVDVKSVSPGAARYGALLSPQGKFLHDFFLLDAGDNILLDTEGARAEELAKRLKMYRLKAKVEIAAKPELSVFAFLDEAPAAPPGLISILDPRLPKLGTRLYGNDSACRNWLAEQGFVEAGMEEYEKLRIALGVPDGSRDMIVDRSFIMENGFEALNGVDFNKGCYVGQEVTARSKFRATLRKGLYNVRGEKTLPASGTPVLSGDKTVGEIRSILGTEGLAILQAESVENGGKLLAGEVVIHASKPTWNTGETAGGAA